MRRDLADNPGGAGRALEVVSPGLAARRDARQGEFAGLGAAKAQTVRLRRSAPGYTSHRFLKRHSTMETIFDYQPTPDELRYLARPDPAGYRARVTRDEALEALSMLFAMRGDEVRSDAYAAQISDKAYLLFELDNHDLIASASIRKSASSGIDTASKAA